jgi:hypothetical protein
MATPFSLIDDGRTSELSATVSAGRVLLAPEEVRVGLGFELKPEGLCRGSTCIPVRDPEALAGQAGVDLEELASALGRPLALDVEERAAALGTGASERAASMHGLEAPDFALPDLDGRMHRLSEHRGKKVLLIAYASW